MKKFISLILSLAMIVAFIPSGMFAIRVSAANGYTFHYYTVATNEIAIIDVEGTINGEFTIPSKINGNTVVAIKSIGSTFNAFGFQLNLTSVTIPNTVREIGEGAFEHCIDLKTVTIPNSVTSIGKEAFRDCGSLTSIIIPDSVTSIGESAFQNCGRLSNLTIGSGVRTIGNFAFEKCRGAETLVIPDRVTSIGDMAFWYCSNLTNVTIGKSVESIGKQAFYECENLTEIAIPDSVTSIGGSAFANCPKLTNVLIGKGVSNIESRTFSNCNNLKNITLTNNLVDIADGAFAQSNIETINFIGDSSEWKAKAYSKDEAFSNAEVSFSCIDGHYTDEYDGYCEECGKSRIVPFSGGDGTASNPYLIQNKYQLNNVRNHLSSNFRLINDVEFNKSDFDEGGQFYNFGECWQPIGSASEYFSGIFDGDSYSIKKLEMLHASDESYGFTGLFYGNEGTIKNLKLEEASLAGGSMWTSYTATQGFIVGANDTTGVIDNCIVDNNSIIACMGFGPMVVGGIAGTNYGNITNCDNQTKITSVSSSSSTVYFGGIVGINSDGMISNCNNNSYISVCGSASNKAIFVGGIVGGISKGKVVSCTNFKEIVGNFATSTTFKSAVDTGGIAGSVTGEAYIENCVNYGKVSAYGYYNTAVAGGIVGLAGSDSAIIKECFNAEKITASSVGSTKYAVAGGICGSYNGTMYNSYNCGRVCADDYIGGLIGYMDGTSKVYNSYNAGSLALNDSVGYIGGLVGGRMAGEFFECYYLNNTSNSVGLGGENGNANAIKIDDMKKESTFSNFDFKSTWTMDGNSTYLYPELKNATMVYVPYKTGDLTGDDKINSLDGLMLLRYLNGWNINIAVPEAMDVNGDGKVNSLDGLMLLRYLNGWNIQLG